VNNFYDQLKNEIEISFNTGKEKATPQNQEIALATIIGLIDLKLAQVTSHV